ncbi:TPA: hypothetical protein R1733_001430 [Campylobacter lari]|nr:hypothetical protein [Campylobacter lari]
MNFLIFFGVASFASFASAAVTVSEAGVMSGSLDMAPFFGGVAIVIAAIGTIVAVKAGIKMLKSI